MVMAVFTINIIQSYNNNCDFVLSAVFFLLMGKVTVIVVNSQNISRNECLTACCVCVRCVCRLELSGASQKTLYIG